MIEDEDDLMDSYDEALMDLFLAYDFGEIGKLAEFKAFCEFLKNEALQQEEE